MSQTTEAGPRTPRFSVVLPVFNQADHIEAIVSDYLGAIDRVGLDAEIVLVPNNCRDASADLCRAMARRDARLVVVELREGGWGRAVRAGLAAAQGNSLCYTNSARTTARMLAIALQFAGNHPDVVVKAQRKIRDNLRRQGGSLLYNLECRLLFDLATWDVNGTPKVFPRSFSGLRQLRRDDDLVDAEFVATCRRKGYPIVELPVALTVRHGGQSTTRWRSAWHMYRGAVSLRRETGIR